MAHDGTALGALKEIIKDNGGTTDAETIVPALEDLGKVIAAGGGGGSVPDGSITTPKLAKDAVTADKMADNSVYGSSIADDAISRRHLSPELERELAFSSEVDTEVKKIAPIAADAATLQVLQALGFESMVLTPASIGTKYTWPYLRLCWIHGTMLESAPIYFSGNLQTQATTLWAKGLNSKATGTLGVDTSWTITANE